MTQRPVLHFNVFELDGEKRPFVAKWVTGVFHVEGKEVAMTLGVPAGLANESGAEAYRRELVKVRDALSDMIANPHGIRL